MRISKAAPGSCLGLSGDPGKSNKMSLGRSWESASVLAGEFQGELDANVNANLRYPKTGKKPGT